MRFEGKCEGYACYASCCNGQTTFRCEVINKEFDSAEAMERAVKAYDLKLRKDFVNKTAFYQGYGTPIQEVEVTSLDGTGHAWINVNGDRRKVRLDELFASRDEMERAVAFQMDMDAAIKRCWATATRWTPQRA